MARIYLLDTNIISEVIKPKPNQRVLEKLEAYTNYSAISSITWSEAWFGVNLMANGKKKEYISNYLIEKIQADFPIIGMDNHAAFILGDIRAKLQKQGIIKDVLDLQIASIAISNNMILVTRNTRDFEDIPTLMMENWFAEG